MECQGNREREGLESEFYESSLGDRRRTKRLCSIAAALGSHAGESLPKALSAVADREATYRFLSNPNVSMEGILSGHFECTAQRARQYDVVLVVHDTSEFAFSTPRKGLGRLRGKTSDHGFFSHISLCVGLDGGRDPLGLLSVMPWTRTETTKKMRKASGVSEMHRWWTCAAKSEHRLGTDGPAAIHVMDREGDSFELFARLVADDARFIVRACHDRKLRDSMDKLFEVGRRAPIRAVRNVSLSPRRQPKTFRTRQIYPARRRREAELSVRATEVCLNRPRELCGRRNLAKEFKLNFVNVQETNCPEGLEPVEWHLLTTEPIETDEDILAIVDAYRARWIVEELFKALKTGCRFEKLQLESYLALQRALGIYLPVAWFLLRLRYLSGLSRDVPASVLLNDVQLTVLRTAYKKQLPAQPCLRDALLAVAAIGGHIKSNGEPGWQVLFRGLHDILLLETGFRAALGEAQSDQS
jgi:hypothetical protein